METTIAYLQRLDEVGDMILSVPMCAKAWEWLRPYFFHEQGDLVSVAVVLVFMLPLFIVYRFSCKAIGYRLGRICRLKERDASKFSESFLFLVTYGTFFVIGALSAYNRGYLFDPVAVYADRTDIGFWGLLLLHLELCHYIAALLLIFADVRNKHKDIPIMFAHHVITLALIAMTVGTGQERLFVQCVAYHDFTDIFLEFAKIFHYVIGEPLSGLPFVAFASSFLYTRLFMLPKHIFLPLIFHGPELNGGVMPLHRSLSVFFSLLYCLHVMWSYMILKMIFGIMFGSVRGDIRSDTEEPSKKKSSKKVE